MANLNRTLNKVKLALTQKGMMPYINQEQFTNKEGNISTKYILHYGNPGYKNKNAYAICYGKMQLIKTLVEILHKEGEKNE